MIYVIAALFGVVLFHIDARITEDVKNEMENY
jgi:hypothetical protein